MFRQSATGCRVKPPALEDAAGLSPAELCASPIRGGTAGCGLGGGRRRALVRGHLPVSANAPQHTWPAWALVWWARGVRVGPTTATIRQIVNLARPVAWPT
ncbi:hypothetical protein GCM10010442_34210 [Kitasatospora kifunensis]